MSGRPRRIRVATEEERALWRAVNRETIPLHAPAMVQHAEPVPPPPAPATPAPPPRAEPQFERLLRLKPQVAEASAPPVQFDLRPSPLDELLDRTPGLDRRTARDLKRGRRDPDARIDLHGMTMDKAQGALTRFIHRSRQQGHRCVLVITGKGAAYRAGEDEFHDLMNRGGSLRRDVPRWLRLPPLNQSITGVFQAHQRHGGDGALYVYLKKRHG